jgi:hypothetical protein
MLWQDQQLSLDNGRPMGIDVIRGAPVHYPQIGSVGDQTTITHELDIIVSGR